MKEDSLLFQIKSLDRLIERYLAKSFDCITLEKLIPNPTLTQLRIIGIVINSKENIYQRDLEKMLNLRRATVSGVLQTMEKNNLIRRVEVNDDARIKKIILNKNTEEIFSNHIDKIKKIESIIISDINAKDLKTFCKVIDLMKNNLI